MVEKKKGDYEPLDITKSACFTPSSNLKGMGRTIQEIDMFTTWFYNEEELRNTLLNEGILPVEYSSKPLSTRIKKKEGYKKVTYDFLYQKDIEYLINPKLVIERVEEKLRQGDYRFIEKYANHFLKYHNCASTAPEVRDYAIFSIRTGWKSPHFADLDENQDKPLTRMTKLLIYKYYQNPDGKIEYKNEINFLYLHHIITFINNYDAKCEKEKRLNQPASTQEKPQVIPNVKKRTKKKKEKREYIEGQCSLFDN